MDYAPQIEPLFIFAVFMLGARDKAFAAVCDTMGEHSGNTDAWLPALVARLVSAERAARETAARLDRFSELTDILRSDSTIPVDLSHPLVQGDARRLSVLLWELQRTCLISTLRALAPERRAAFILVNVLGLSIDDTADALRSNRVALKTLYLRATNELADYLGPRCEHMHKFNPCRCPDRLGNALARGFIGWPDHDDYGSAPHSREVHKDVSGLYAALPRVRLPVVR